MPNVKIYLGLKICWKYQKGPVSGNSYQDYKPIAMLKKWHKFCKVYDMIEMEFFTTIFISMSYTEKTPPLISGIFFSSVGSIYL